MRWRTAEVARATGGELVGPDVEVDGAAIDSRQVRGGELFVAVLGRRDGHEFVPDALAAGASAYLSARRPEELDGRAAPATAVVVADTAEALASLGQAARARLPDRVVGITGSTGKTSTKDLLGAALAHRYRCAVSPRSFNNELGVPLTLVNAGDDSEAAVLEMGARGPGHIEWLCRLARPTAGLVTNVGPAHTATLGSPEGVARAKGELVAALPPWGLAVLNADDERVAAMAARTSARVVTFGSGDGDVRVEGLALDAGLRPAFRLRTPWGQAEVRLEARGAHQAINAAAAAAAALALDVPLDEVVPALAAARLSQWRLEVARSPSGAVVLNDAYNANPTSTEAALRALAQLDARRRMAVLGPMLELGRLSNAEHARMGRLAYQLGVDRLVTVGAPGYGGEDVPGVEEALALLGPLGEGDAVLVKGSRAAGMERLVARLLEPEGAAW